MQKKSSVSLKHFSAIRIGGTADTVYFPEAVSEFIELLLAKPDLPVVGGCTNVFFGDLPELVCTKHLDKIAETPDGITAECGALLAELFDFAAGVPATVGGGIKMNFGAFGFELKDFLISAQVFYSNGIKTLSADELHLGYRTADFSGVILSALFKQKQLAKTAEFLAQRRAKMPWGKPNLGSIFKNPPGLSAGKLIEDAGLKGYRHKDLQISEQHANVIVNHGTATAADLQELINYIRSKVKENLELEIRYIG